MSNINETKSIPSNLMDSSSSPIETKISMNNIKKISNYIEQNITSLLSTSIEQESFEKNMKTKLSEPQDQIMMKEEQEEKLQFDYNNLSNDDIKERFLLIIQDPISLRNQIKQWLETDTTLLVFIRQNATLLAQYYSLKTELQLYQTYINMTQSVFDWLSTMPQILIKRFNINKNFFKIQSYINKQLKNSEQ
ncbi:unnamed protein product [Rotaria sp. Silwood2]|nr:unnamed protein product [Rotaria sp. Silwood2]CAF3034503.1 unnamed protein product [Rotaria sp. Silwood2]CAF4586214.1 unnamed protein product [Rotaria sp. Silwood2]CAF4620587.1 unnamed protein product [Rotaria sp. Silwood2]